MNNGGTQTPTSTGSDTGVASDASTSWVSKTDRHLQLINSAVYEKESHNRAKAIEETRRLKMRQRDESEIAKLKGFVIHQARANPAMPTNTAGTGKSGRYEVDVDGIRFVVAKNGSKLIKISGRADFDGGMAGSVAEVHSGDVGASTPKTAMVGGVKFYRSKNGNLYRDGILRAHRYVSPFRPIRLLIFVRQEIR